MNSAMLRNWVNNMKVVIDRFEGNFVVCEREDKSFINIERSLVPSEAKEGDVLTVNDTNIRMNKNETYRRKREVEKLAEDLWE
jgi:hypothetical protein